jgi:hypothetical protein
VSDPYIFDGLPFRGTPPQLKTNDPAHMRPVKDIEAHVKTFLTTNEEDMKEYTAVWSSITRKHAVLGAEERVYDESIKGWRIFMRWCDIFYKMPDTKAR